MRFQDLKNVRKIIVSLVIFLLIIAGFSLYVSRHPEEFRKILSVRIIDFSVISFLVIVTFALNGLVAKVLLDFFNVKIKTTEWFGLSVLNKLGNYLPVRIGPVLRAVYLKKAYNFNYTTFISCMGVASVIVILSSGLIGIAGMAVMYFTFDAFSPILFLLFVLISLGALFLIIFSPVIRSSENKIMRRISNVIEGWNSIKKDKKLLLKLFCISILAIFIYAVRVYYASFALGYNFPFLYALLIGIPSSLSVFLIIVPAGLGVREAVMGFSSKLLAKTTLSGVVIGSLDRVVAMIWVVVMGSIFALLLSRRLAKKQNP